MPAQSPEPVVQVGVGVIVTRDGLLLLGERRGSHGAGTWALPGGHLEYGETIEDCARREVLEETGLTLGGFHRASFTSDVFPQERRHYVTLFMQAEAGDGEARVMEPDKCVRWLWCRWSDLHAPALQPLFLPLASLRDSGFVPAGLR